MNEASRIYMEIANQNRQELEDDRQRNPDKTWQGKMLVSGKSSHPAYLAKLKGIQSIRICGDPRYFTRLGAKESRRESGTRRSGLPAFQKLDSAVEVGARVRGGAKQPWKQLLSPSTSDRRW